MTPRRSQKSRAVTSNMFARLPLSAWAAAPSRSFTSGGTRSVSVAVLVCVRAKASPLADYVYAVALVRGRSQ
jgi:hypothetical protein